MAGRQSPLDRARRLRNGCCPVHGIPMHQTGNWHCPVHGYADSCPRGCTAEVYTIVGCPRRDCSVRCTATEAYGPAYLLASCAHLLHDDTNRAASR